MLSNDVQKILPTTNWMLPAVKTGQALPEAFKESEIPKVVLGFTPEEVSANRKNWIKRWLGAVAK
jgi:thiamine transport system substrate-binding protein